MTANAQEVVDSLISLWGEDNEWLDRVDGGFVHWLYALPQWVLITDDANDLLDFESRIEVVTQIENRGRALGLCLALNRFCVGFAYIYDDATKSIDCLASYWGRADWTRPYSRWLADSNLAYWHANRIASQLADDVAGIACSFTPPGRTEVRRDPHPELGYLDWLRTRPGWAFDPVWHGGPALPSIAESMAARISDFALVEDLSDTRLRLRVSHRDWIEAAAKAGEPAPVRARYDLMAWWGRRYPFGRTVTACLRFPLAEVVEGTEAEIANNLNVALAKAKGVRGSFYVSDGYIAYDIATPSFVLDSLARQTDGSDLNLVLTEVFSNLKRAMEVVDAAGIGRPHDDAPWNGPVTPGTPADPYLQDIASGASQAIVERPQEAAEPDSRLLWANHVTDLVTTAIFNPVGPTITTLQLGGTHGDRWRPLLRIMRHPFSPEYGVVGFAETEDELAALIQAAMPPDIGSLPEAVHLTAPEDLWDVTFSSVVEALNAKWLESGEGESIGQRAAVLRHYAGRAWDRLNKTDEVAMPASPYVGVEGIEYAQEPGEGRAFEDWFYAVTATDNVFGTLLQMNSAWDGAIGFLEEASASDQSAE